MFYWVIPYLVAYNVSETANWRNGPIHQFEAEVKANVTTENHDEMHSHLKILFACRPFETNIIRCRIDKATIDNYEIKANDPNPVRSHNPSEFGSLSSVVFHVEFDKSGITNVTFPNTRGYFRENIIRSLIGDFGAGIDLTDYELGKWTLTDKFVSGNCETDFHMMKISKRENERMMQENFAVYNMTVVPFNLSEDETIAVEKVRKMDKCWKYTPYLFGSTEQSYTDEKKGLRMENHVTVSRSKIYLGKNRFNSFTENLGTIWTKSATPLSTNGKKTMTMKTGESIRLTLTAIVEAAD